MKFSDLSTEKMVEIMESVFAYEKANSCQLYRADFPRGDTTTYWVEDARHEERTVYADRSFDWNDPEVVVSEEDDGFLIGVGMRHINFCGAEFVPFVEKKNE
jgi:hypothetical protein